MPRDKFSDIHSICTYEVTLQLLPLTLFWLYRSATSDEDDFYIKINRFDETKIFHVDNFFI